MRRIRTCTARLTAAEWTLQGILMPTGYFTEEVQKYSEGAPMELINVSKLREILHAHDMAWPSSD